MNDSDVIGRFFRTYAAEAVGDTPPQPVLEGLAEGEAVEGDGTVDLNVEMPAGTWIACIVGEAPAKPGEHPIRFIDGSLSTLPVLCLRSPQGWPIPLLVSEAGAVAVRLTGRSFVREFVAVERVLSFVADPFPWAEVEAFASAVLHDPDLSARLVPANRPVAERNPFDYEVMRTQASHRCEQEMLNAERLALAADPTLPALVDGKLAGRIGSTAAAARPLLVGVVKRARPDLHAEGWRTLLGLRPGQRTPVFKLSGISGGKEADMPTVSWFLKLASGPRLAPNWGYVRVDVPWVQFQGAHRGDFGFVDRVSRWLIDARCRQASYARMPVSLEPIVRAEECLQPLFTPLPILSTSPVQTGRDDGELTVMSTFPELDLALSPAAANAATGIPLGRVAAPPGHESTSGMFHFWVDRKQTVERTQIVTTSCNIAGRVVKFIGIAQEVYRRSRQKDIGEEADRFDGRSAEQTPFDSEGVTYAEVAILRTDPVAHTPPTEESVVYLADAADAARGYGLDRMGQRLDVGLLRNGGTHFAGRAAIDLDFLLGKNGGHMNVNGIAGLGAKSTLLLIVSWLLLEEAARQKLEKPGDPRRLQVVPVVFNVKNFDLFFIDRWNSQFLKEEIHHRDDWKHMGVADPRPFENAAFFAPQQKAMSTPVTTGRPGNDVKPYSWSLADVIEQRLFKYLFSEEDVYEPNFGGLVGELEEWLTNETAGGPKLRTTTDAPQTFQGLLDWFKRNKGDKDFFGDSHAGTKGKFLRRLKYVVQEGDGVLRRTDPKGSPLLIPAAGVDGPLVIDLFGIHRTPSLQRFVVATVFHQIIEYRSGKQGPGLRYLITLDELNRFVPKGSADPITQQIEMVAAEMRSQGVILFGAQQQASLVSPRVIENAAVRAIGRSGTLELNQEVWRFLSPSARSAAAQLQLDEKLLYQPSFREPMLAKIPCPPFALSEGDAAPLPGDSVDVPGPMSPSEAEFA